MKKKDYKALANGMSPKIDPSELKVINDLLGDFAADPKLTAEEVYKKSWSRFSILEQVDLNLLLGINDSSTDDMYSALPLMFHEFIYDGLFTFAGRYRSKYDPHGGTIYFGKQNAQQRIPPFSGTRPDEIENKVKAAARFLSDFSKDPIYSVACFYQKFVGVHPFYDANGRIGRLISTIYLANHNLALSWSEFNSKGKFLKKLNRCHRKPDEESLGYLAHYLRRFKLTLDEIDRQ